MTFPSRLREGSGVGTVAGVRRPTLRAQRLRRNATPEERRLWQQIGASRLGWKFSRQMPVGPYICDFLCRSACVAIELDGDFHAASAAHDDRRDAFIRSLGISILRFSNADVMGDIEGVVLKIVNVLEQKPHPRPLPQAGGEL